MHRKISVMTTTALIGIAATEAPMVWASDFIADSLVQVSGVSPFGPLSNCGDFPDTPPGTVWLDSEVEPWIGVNPINPANIVGSWQQDRWSNGGARGLVAGASFDGGATWTMVPIPGVTDCTGGEFHRATDPWLSFAPNGDLYQMSLAFDVDLPGTEGSSTNAMLVSKSEDGGLSWSDPISLIRDEDPRFFNDKNSITADPTDSNFVYAVWDRLELPAGMEGNAEQRYGFGFKGPAMLARTTDGGATWEPARVIYEPGVNNQTIGNQIVVQPNGTLVNFFDEMRSFRGNDGTVSSELNVSLIRSTDRGVTWSRPIRAHELLTIGVFDPETGDYISHRGYHPRTRS